MKKRTTLEIIKLLYQQADFAYDLVLEETIKWQDLEAMKVDVESKIKLYEETGEMQRTDEVSLWLKRIQNIKEEIEEIGLRPQKIQSECHKSAWKVVDVLRDVDYLNTEGRRFFCGDYQITYKLPRNQVPLVPLPSPIVFEHSPGTFTYEELEWATKGFSESNFLGQGAFGTVHKGILPNKQTVAIKQQKSGSKQGMQEFQTEVTVISRVHHRHLVYLVGYCIAEAQMTLMLVYEFVPNKTLEFHLHGKGTKTLDWSTRMKIAIGSAKGLAYLHEDCQPKIIHRDIKAANILLDDKFEPKIADFGLAKLSSDTDTHVSTAHVKGTFGYVAPEYVTSGRLSEKADVFSFGVVLLELIAGQKPVLETGSFPDNSLVERARPLLFKALENRNFEVLADPRLQNNYGSEEMFRMASCAANCVRPSPDHRPRMSQVMDALTGKINLDNWNNTSGQPRHEQDLEAVTSKGGKCN